MTAEFYRDLLDDYLRQHVAARWAKAPELANSLREAFEYSLHTGGKRFRPQVTFLTAEALACDYTRVLPFAAAVEMVHTYSLIHDDLPCMDDDDFRRDRPTNHRVYGEATALLAGDALLTEAFTLLGEAYDGVPDVGLKLVRELGEAAGLTGMIAGQIMDIHMLTKKTAPNLNSLADMQALKTGALILVAVRGAAIAARATPAQLKALTVYGENLGLCFQLADDILDFNPKEAEESGYPALIGVEKTRALLAETAQKALTAIEVFGPTAAGLRQLVEINLNRKV